jgi:hypothetical protein
MIGKLIFHGLVGCIAERVFEDDARYPRILIVERDERIPACQLYLERYGGITELGFSERILPFENALCKAREPLESSAAQSLPLETLVKYLERWKRSLNELSDA